MIKAIYSEADGPRGHTRRLEVSGHAGYAPAGQDIVCAGASCLMQALVCLAVGVEGASCTACDGPDGPRVAVIAAPEVDDRDLLGGFELAKTGLALLAERYPDNLRFADISRRAEQAMLDLQLFAEEGGAPAAPPAPVLSQAQARQAAASGTLHTRAEAQGAPPRQAEQTPPPARPRPVPPYAGARSEAGRFIRALHGQWAREEAELRREDPAFSLRSALQSPEMRRMMRMPGMRVRDAYRAANYDRLMAGTARAVEQGVVERVRARAARPAENGGHSGGAAVTAPDVSRMSRAQREALEREVLHGAKIRL